MQGGNHLFTALNGDVDFIAVTQAEILPYPKTFGKSEIKTGYVSGACTHPDYRNRGAMRELLSQGLPGSPFPYAGYNMGVPAFSGLNSDMILPDNHLFCSEQPFCQRW